MLKYMLLDPVIWSSLDTRRKRHPKGLKWLTSRIRRHRGVPKDAVRDVGSSGSGSTKGEQVGSELVKRDVDQWREHIAASQRTRTNIPDVSVVEHWSVTHELEEDVGKDAEGGGRTLG